MTRLLKILPAAVFILPSAAAVADEGDWYVAPSIAYFDDDGDRKIDDGVSGGQIQVGREMGEHFLLEGLLGYHDIDGYPAQEHLELGFNVIGRFLPDNLFSPYVIGGVGFLQADVGEPSFGGLPPAGTSSSSATATAGLGLLVDLGDSPWSLRTEWRFRHAFEDSGLTDQVVSLGIQYSFGGGRDRAAPASSTPPPPVVYTDSDGDGVTDERDRCPGTRAGAKVDLNGCEIEEKVEFGNTYFGFDSDVILPTSKRQLDKMAALMLRHPDLQIEIAGFADARGPERYNNELSQRRAEAVRDYLVKANVNPANLTVKAYGEAESAASDQSANSLAHSRRVELRITNR